MTRTKSYARYRALEVLWALRSGRTKKRLAEVSRYDQIVYLTLHSVDTRPSLFCYVNQLNINPSRLEMLIESMKEYGTFADPERVLISGPAKGQGLQFILTFDDGFMSVDRICRRILKKHGIKPIVFINSGCIERGELMASVVSVLEKGKSLEMQCLRVTPKDYHDYVRKLTAKERDLLRNLQGQMMTTKVVRSLVEERLIVLGNHLSNHWNCSSQTALDISESFIECEEYIMRMQGYTLGAFAYPNGQPVTCFNDDCISIIGKCGGKIQFSNTNNCNLRNYGVVESRIAVSPWESQHGIGIKVLREVEAKIGKC